MQQERVDQVPETPDQIMEKERQAATAAEMSSASMGPSSPPAWLNRQPDSGLDEILNPPDADESFNRLLRLQDNARNNPAMLSRKKRIMQAGLEMAETGTFRARRPDRYMVVV